MLYDILPPLLFFISLGGIIFVVSRVVARVKRQELSHAIQTEGARLSRPAHQLLNPGENKVTLMKSRLSAIGSSMGESLHSLRELPTRVKERRQEVAREAAQADVAAVSPEPSELAIQAPRSSWREKLSGLTAAAGQKLSRAQRSLRTGLEQVRQRRQPSAPMPASEAESSAPAARAASRVSLRRVDTAPSAFASSRLETTTERLQALVRKSRATTSPIQAAKDALDQNHIDKAEDLLVPYIAKHPKNTAAYLLLAEIAFARGTWEEAVEVLEQVIRLDRATPSAYARLGEACLQAGHVTRALEALQRAHDADPSDVGVLKNLLKIAERRDNQVLQNGVVQKLIVLAPDDPEVHLAAENLEARQEQREQTPAA